jgi:hypothetical protein
MLRVRRPMSLPVTKLKPVREKLVVVGRLVGLEGPEVFQVEG